MKKREYQIFDKIIKFGNGDEDRLKPFLQSWNTLHEHLAKDDGEHTEENLIKLIVIERETMNRNHMISRIHSRMVSYRRNRQKEELGI